MVKKGIAIILFLIVSAGFLYGFISYNRRLSKMMNQEIERAEASEEPDTPVETPDPEEPGNTDLPEPIEEPDEAEALITIPDIVGLSEEDAVKALKDKGLTAEIHLEYIDGIEKGFVFYQRPPRNNEVPKGTVVGFSVSRGPYGSSGTVVKVKVPDLKGKTEAEAKVLLSSVKLKMRSVNVYSDTVSSGQIISQDVPVGREADEGSTVSVEVSLGKELIDVPNVINLKEADAKSLIESKGFKISVKREYSDKASLVVISQSPAAGKAAKGSVISVTVSSGPKPQAPVPDPVVPDRDPVEPVQPDPDPIDDPVETPNG